MLNLHRLRWLVLIILCALLPACRAPQPIPPTLTATPAATSIPPTPVPNVIDEATGLIPEGTHFIDPADTEPAFLDVIGFTVTVDEATDRVEAVFELRELPTDKVRRNQFEEPVFEYSWNVQIFTCSTDADALPNYVLHAFTTNIPGLSSSYEFKPQDVDFAALFDQVDVVEQETEGCPYLGYTRTAERVIDLERNTITLIATVPDITNEALFLFSTGQYQGGQDDPDIP